MSIPPTPFGPTPNHRQPSAGLLLALYSHLPVLVVHVSQEGVVLHCNPEALRVTGYTESALVGRNLWATLFPGRLFAQVPKFIAANSGQTPPPPLRDVPLTMRTKNGQERIVAWTRFVYESVGAEGTAQRSIVLLGVDLTDRLLESDKHGQPREREGFGANVGNGGTVEGEFVKPLAISPPSPRKSGEAPSPAEQVNQCLGELDVRAGALERVWVENEVGMMKMLGEGMRGAGGEWASRAEGLQAGAVEGALGPVGELVKEIVAMCRMEKKG